MATPIQFGNEYEVAYTVATNDGFATRYVVGDPAPSRAISIDLSSYTMESGEPNPQTVTNTAWYEYKLSTPPSRLHLWVDGASSTGAIEVYRKMYETISNPALTDLVAVAGGSDVWLDPLDDSYASYYIQVGLKTGTGADLVLHMESGDIPAGGSFDTAVDITGRWGVAYADLNNASLETGEPVPAGITPTASSWLKWICPNPAPSGETFTILPSGVAGHVGLGIYTGAAVNALSTVAQSSGLATSAVSVHWTPVADTTYYIQITTESPATSQGLAWLPDSELVAPGDVPQGLVVKVYQPDGLTLITELPRRQGSRFQEALNVIQSGEVSVSLYDDVLQAYPNALDAGNVVKFWLGSTCASGFRIQKEETKWISNNEYVDVVKKVSGPTLNCFMQDFIVHHDVAPRPDSPNTRFYSWASRPDEWYNAARWNHKIMASSQTNPPGNWGHKPKKRRRYGQPKKWPDKASYHFWITNNKARNGNWKPPYNTDNRFYRKNFNLRSDQLTRLFVTGDAGLVVYIDGEQVLSRGGGENGIKSFAKQNIMMRAGDHTIAVYASASGAVGKDGVDSFMLSLYKVDDDGSRGRIILRTNKGAKGWLAYYGPNPQSWNRAMVIRNTFKEAIARGNGSAVKLAESNALTGLKFSATADSRGVRWTDTFTQEVQIGSSCYEVQQLCTEGGHFDMWVNPDTLDVYAYNFRGDDRSQSVAIVPGRNVLDWGATKEDQIANVFLVHFDGGFVEVADWASVAQYGRRELYVELNGVKTAGDAVALMRAVIAGNKDAIERAGTPDQVSRPIDSPDTGGLIGVPGAYPFIDFNIGDVISAPSSGITGYRRMRVLSLTCVEDAEGNLTFDPDLDGV